MATVITRAFEHWQAGQVLNNLPARPDTIIFAHVPGLDPTADINPDEGIPADGQIVHRDAVAQYGMINDSAVAYSVVLDTRVGDFTFNWIGLVDAASNTLCMIVHTPAQQKIATANGVQGNNITRTFLMEFAGAAEASQITVSAQTWQIDFSARLRGIDEVNRLANLDYYGHAAFFGDGFSVSKDGDKYRVKAGLAYIGGIRALLADDVLLEAAAGNVVYADVSYQGSVLSEFAPIIHLGVKHSAGDFGDYTDANGFTHYIASLALITASGEDDKREANPFDKAIADINAALKEHEKSRNHPDATLNAKGFTQLSSAVDSDSETLAATLKAVKIVMENANARLAKDRNGADIPNIALFRQNLGVKGAALLDVGTTAGTVAAGNDSRIVNAVQSTNTAITLPGSLTIAGTLRGSSVISVDYVSSGNGISWLATDGNVYGPAWGGYLNEHIDKLRNNYGVVAMARGASVVQSYTAEAPAGTYATNSGASTMRYRALFFQRPTGAWVQMGGDIG
ncbi:phage tail protein [Yersinia enterocolitica]|uniref:phage tail-collar fiber domain-containing protein n=1 Tax=Yersinia enterocolitica TaxID=630 RepID=UPI0021E97EA7|nr:phage tail protein [Yersinia enterocolitica]UYK08893.1 phage tail protein [Yersinia enterocolitica]HDL7969170.1 phage tail protein [Yersinia enterocolitica]